MGATVYITGRKKETLYLTAKEIGESCRPIVCDHSDDSQGGFLQLIGEPIRRLCGTTCVQGPIRKLCLKPNQSRKNVQAD